MIRVLVTGGRKYADCVVVWGKLDSLLNQHGNLILIEGGGTGADFLAREWSYKHPDTVTLITEKADWNSTSRNDAAIVTRDDGSQYDANAGPRRNQRMIDLHHPDICIAFPGGRGTKDCVRRARKARVQVNTVGW